MFYSEQGAAFTEAEESGLSRQVAQRKFIDFLRNFRGEPSPGRTDGETVYRDRLDSDPPPATLTVQLEDLIAHDAELADALKKNPRLYVPLVRARARGARRTPAANCQRGFGGKGRRAALTARRCAYAAGGGLCGRACVVAQRAAGGRGARAAGGASFPRVLAGHDAHSRARGAQLAPAPARRAATVLTRRMWRRTQSHDVSKLVCVPGIVIAASRCKARCAAGTHTRVRMRLA